MGIGVLVLSLEQRERVVVDVGRPTGTEGSNFEEQRGQDGEECQECALRDGQGGPDRSAFFLPMHLKPTAKGTRSPLVQQRTPGQALISL